MSVLIVKPRERNSFRHGPKKDMPMNANAKRSSEKDIKKATSGRQAFSSVRNIADRFGSIEKYLKTFIVRRNDVAPPSVSTLRKSTK